MSICECTEVFEGKCTYMHTERKYKYKTLEHRLCSSGRCVCECNGVCGCGTAMYRTGEYMYICITVYLCCMHMNVQARMHLYAYRSHWLAI